MSLPSGCVKLNVAYRRLLLAVADLQTHQENIMTQQLNTSGERSAVGVHADLTRLEDAILHQLDQNEQSKPA